MKYVFVVLYLWASFWTGIIADMTIHRPMDPVGRVFDCMLLGVLWPISLPTHLYDFPLKEAK